MIEGPSKVCITQIMALRGLFGLANGQLRQLSYHHVGIYKGRIIRVIDFLYHVAFGQNGPSMELAIKVSEGRMCVKHVGLCLLGQHIATSELATKGGIDAVIPFGCVLHIVKRDAIVYIVGWFAVEIAPLEHSCERKRPE